MRPLKILMLTTFFHPDKFGGGERVVFELARGLSALGHDVKVLTHRAPDTKEEELLAGFRVKRYPATFSSRFGFYYSVFRGAKKALKCCMKEERFDIVHTHQLLSAFAAHFPLSIAKEKTVASFYAPYHKEFETKHLEGRPASESSTGLRPGAALVSRLLAKADALVLKRAAAVVVLSRFSLSQVENLSENAAKKTSVIPAGVDLERFCPAADADRQALKKRIGLPAGQPVLLCVRRLVERMGIEDLIDAAGMLAEQNVRFSLVIGGEGPLCTSLEDRAGASPAAGLIRFTGRIPEKELPDWYRASDLFVLPTRSLEGFGMVTLEAMACGVPVAGSNVGATPELIKPLDPALIFEEPGPASMADKLKVLLADTGKLDSLGKKAREIAMRGHGWDIAAKKTLAVYRKVLDTHGTGTKGAQT